MKRLFLTTCKNFSKNKIFIWGCLAILIVAMLFISINAFHKSVLQEDDFKQIYDKELDLQKLEASRKFVIAQLLHYNGDENYLNYLENGQTLISLSTAEELKIAQQNLAGYDYWIAHINEREDYLTHRYKDYVDAYTFNIVQVKNTNFDSSYMAETLSKNCFFLYLFIAFILGYMLHFADYGSGVIKHYIISGVKIKTLINAKLLFATLIYLSVTLIPLLFSIGYSTISPKSYIMYPLYNKVYITSATTKYLSLHLSYIVIGWFIMTMILIMLMRFNKKVLPMIACGSMLIIIMSIGMLLNNSYTGLYNRFVPIYGMYDSVHSILDYMYWVNIFAPIVLVVLFVQISFNKKILDKYEFICAT